MTSPSENIGALNVTPLIDILLVLLTIFMVITPLSSHGITAGLPQTSVAGASMPEPEIVLEITHDRQFLLNGQPVLRSELSVKISELYRTRVSQELFIRADRNLEYGDVARVMDDI
jgi:biopolymer transport protein ExbD